jgi:hypothetical protein
VHATIIAAKTQLSPVNWSSVMLGSPKFSGLELSAAPFGPRMPFSVDTSTPLVKKFVVLLSLRFQLALKMLVSLR